jgi:glycosyltransferase A (GT-A) superfamily protein (DUF2064 family)
MDARPPRIALCIMAKAPASGYVKTRLCPPLSLEEAAQLYQCFLEDKIAQVRSVQGVELVVAYAPENAAATFAPTVLEEALRRARDLRLRVVQLAPWYDVDTGADLARLMSELEAGGGQGPAHTRRLLLSMGRIFVSGGGL